MVFRILQKSNMFDVFGQLKELLKLNTVCIDNNVFRLHYKVTATILMAFSILVTSTQYIGDPIDCIVDYVPLDVMDTYCWIHTTFTLPKKDLSESAHPGVANHINGKDEIKYHTYYQWVCFVLFFQAILFYLPRYLWKCWEGGRMKMMVDELSFKEVLENEPNYIYRGDVDTHQDNQQEKNKDKKRLLINYFLANLNHQDSYAFLFFFCEILNFLNVVLQIFLTDYFLGGEFSTYGSSVFKFMQMQAEERYDPMERVFPKVTKCTFRIYGASGSIQNYEGLCVLPINIVNEKIYVFLWFWFFSLGVCSAAALIYRGVIILSVRFRFVLLKAKCRRLVEFQNIHLVHKYCKIGDWFILYQISKNIDPVIFKMIMKQLAICIREKKDEV